MLSELRLRIRYRENSKAEVQAEVQESTYVNPAALLKQRMFFFFLSQPQWSKAVFDFDPVPGRKSDI